MPRSFQLSVLPGEFAVCRLPASAAIPAWATRSPLFCVMRTADELSIVCAAGDVPVEAAAAGAQAAAGWRALKLHGPFPFEETGVLAAILAPLAAAGVSIFALSTYDTDYVLVREPQLASAAAALRSAGHTVTP